MDGKERTTTGMEVHVHTLLFKIDSIEKEQQRISCKLEQLQDHLKEIKSTLHQIQLHQKDGNIKLTKTTHTIEHIQAASQETAHNVKIGIHTRVAKRPGYDRPHSVGARTTIRRQERVSPDIKFLHRKRRQRREHNSSLSSNTEDEAFAVGTRRSTVKVIFIVTSYDNIKDLEFERKCMMTAIKRNSVGLIGCMPFNLSNIPDKIIPGIVTESECESIRNESDRKDQIRALIRAVTKRSYEAMVEFVELVEDQNSNISDAIKSAYQDIKNGRDNSSTTICTLCSLRQNVNIKDVCDYYYAKELLSDGLYRYISSTTSGPGDQNELWDMLLAETLKGEPEQFITIMIGALKGIGPFFLQIVTMLVRDIQRKRRFICRCREIIDEMESLSLLSIDTGTSVSPRSISPDVASVSDESICSGI